MHSNSLNMFINLAIFERCCWIFLWNGYIYVIISYTEMDASTIEWLKSNYMKQYDKSWNAVVIWRIVNWKLNNICYLYSLDPILMKKLLFALMSLSQPHQFDPLTITWLGRQQPKNRGRSFLHCFLFQWETRTLAKRLYGFHCFNYIFESLNAMWSFNAEISIFLNLFIILSDSLENNFC